MRLICKCGTSTDHASAYAVLDIEPDAARALASYADLFEEIKAREPGIESIDLLHMVTPAVAWDEFPFRSLDTEEEYDLNDRLFDNEWVVVEVPDEVTDHSDVTWLVVKPWGVCWRAEVVLREGYGVVTTWALSWEQLGILAAGGNPFTREEGS